MKIFDSYPNSTEFKENEFRTLERINNYGLITSDFKDLSQSIGALYSSYVGVNFANYPFKMHIQFYMEVEGHVHRIIVGANVDNTIEMNTYFLAICDRDDKELIRKFHFDFALPKTDEKQRAPVFHLQYGGKSSPEIQEENIGDDKMDKWLSLPRLKFVPMNLALLLDMIFCEFSSIESIKLYEDIEWRNLIKDNELFLYKNYIKDLSDHINSYHYTQKYLIRDFQYGR